MEGYVSDFYADGDKVGRFSVFEHGFEFLALFKALTAHAHLGELLPVDFLGGYLLKGLLLLSCIVRRNDTGRVQHLLVGGDIRCFEHLGENPCAGNNTLEGDFEEVELCGVLELPHEVGEEVLQGIAVLVKLQETLLMFGGGRYSLQSAFLVRP